jgi:integrase
VVSDTARQRSVSTVRRELAVLSAAINWAFKSGRITGTVAVTKPPKPAPRDRWLTRDEAARLIRAAKTAKARFYLPSFVRI